MTDGWVPRLSCLEIIAISVLLWIGILWMVGVI